MSPLLPFLLLLACHGIAASGVAEVVLSVEYGMPALPGHMTTNGFQRIELYRRVYESNFAGTLYSYGSDSPTGSEVANHVFVDAQSATQHTTVSVPESLTTARNITKVETRCGNAPCKYATPYVPYLIVAVRMTPGSAASGIVPAVYATTCGSQRGLYQRHANDDLVDWFNGLSSPSHTDPIADWYSWKYPLAVGQSGDIYPPTTGPTRINSTSSMVFAVNAYNATAAMDSVERSANYTGFASTIGVYSIRLDSVNNTVTPPECTPMNRFAVYTPPEPITVSVCADQPLSPAQAAGVAVAGTASVSIGAGFLLWRFVGVPRMTYTGV